MNLRIKPVECQFLAEERGKQHTKLHLLKTHSIVIQEDSLKLLHPSPKPNQMKEINKDQRTKQSPEESKKKNWRQSRENAKDTLNQTGMQPHDTTLTNNPFLTFPPTQNTQSI